MHIGKAIKKIRVEKDKQQLDVALALGMEQSNYSRIEKAENPKIDRVKEIAKYLGVTHSYIIDVAQTFDDEKEKINDHGLGYKTKTKLESANDIEFLKQSVAHAEKMLGIFMDDVAYWKQEALRFRSKYEALLPKYEALLAKQGGKP
jgi:transcriptional regulator with XRE-family HTH domain